MLIDAIDGQAIDAAFFERARVAPPEPLGVEPAGQGERAADATLRIRAVRGPPRAGDASSREHRIVFRRADDTRLETTVAARGSEVSTRESYALRPSGVAVLSLSRFDSAVRRDLARDIDAAVADSRALILDLRDNSGGEQRLFEWLAGRFVATRVRVAESRERGLTGPSIDPIELGPAERPYRKPIAVPINRATGSAAEPTAHVLVEQRRAIAVGEPTCGCVVAIRRDSVLPDGGALRVSQVGYRTAGGRRMEGDPLQPAIAVEPTLAERRAGTDVVVERPRRPCCADSGVPAVIGRGAC